MISYWRPLAACLVLFGAAGFLYSGVRQLWSASEPPLVGAAPVDDPVPPARDEPATPTPVPEMIVVANAKPLPAPPVAKEPATVKQEVERKKALPRGKKHDAQDTVLAAMMQKLHGEAHKQFIRAPGNGRDRITPLMVTATIKQRPWTSPEWTSEELAKETPPLEEASDLSLIHRLSIFHFGESAAKSPPEQWAAAQAALSAKKQQVWEIKSLDLVGLVMHDEPVVYMSERLPEMKDLKKKTLRPLDVFESEGLEELATGRDLYIRSKDGTVRVLGPIHAGKACLKCHSDAKEGELLGAFSYTLRVAQLEYHNGFSGRPGQPNTLIEQEYLRNSPPLRPVGPSKK